MKKGKLSLKKITVSNLSEDFAKRVFGGDEAPTYANPNGSCTVSCTADNCACTATQDNNCATAGVGCASGPEQPGCTQAQGGCTGQNCESDNQQCFSMQECTLTQCTDQNATCQPTFMDQSCANGPGTCAC